MKMSQAIGFQQNLPATDPTALVSRDIPVPDLGPRDLLVEVQAVSVNPVDVKLRQGADPHGFRVLGFDGAGTVVTTGQEVTLFAVGDEVFYAGAIDRPGSNQSLQVVDERIVGHRPTSVTIAEAASFPLVAITAWEALFDHLQLTPASTGTILIVGATGGVGSFMVQLLRAKAPGVTIIATASTPKRAEWICGLGADQVVNHRGDWVSQVRDLNPEGIDWVFTSYSENKLENYAEVLRPFGRIVAIDDGPRDVSPLKAKAISWHWEFMFARSMFSTTNMTQQHHLLEEVARLVDDGHIIPTVEHFLHPINTDTLRQAHRLVEDGHVMGKVVLDGFPLET